MSASEILRRLYLIGATSPDTSRLLYGLIRHDEEENYLSNLQDSDLARLVDYLDGVLSTIPISDDLYPQCLRKLQAICGHHMTLPSSYTMSGDFSRIGDSPVASGGVADIWEGAHHGRKVCIKQLKVPLDDGRTLTKSFFKEAVTWKRLRHPNVVPFIGVTRGPLQIVSEWMPNGTLTKYIEKNTGVDRIGLLLDVAEGLNYLHANYTIHGDLKGLNILIDHNGHACLTDFGLASIAHGVDSIHATEAQGYTARWTAPEIIGGSNSITKEADAFSFGMIVIEVFTGNVPFSDLKPVSVMYKITSGERPDRPLETEELGLVDSVWDMTLSCWRQDPVHRPPMEKVVRFLRECYTLRAANMSLSTLAPWLPTWKIDDVTYHTPISPVSTNGKPAPTQPPVISQPSNQSSDGVSVDTSPVSEAPQPDDSYTLCGSSGDPSFDYPRALLNSVHNDDHHNVLMSHVPLEAGRNAINEGIRRIDEISKDLLHRNPKSKWKDVVELRMLCGLHFTVPTSYNLEGVTKEGDCAKRLSHLTEIWRGRYNDEVVALKIFRVSHDDPHIQRTKGWFCKEVVLMKQLEHDNILPLYGISTAISDFCLVYPWYRNGNIMDYVKKKPDVNRFDLLSDAANGLHFLHENRLVHSALKPSHILIDDKGNARLATAGRSSIVAVPDTPTPGHTQSGGNGDIDDYRYWAPEIQWPEDHGMDEILLTKESDVYGMGMVAYEVLTGKVPYSGCNDIVTLLKIQTGEIPHRPPNDISDPVWGLLERCWSRDFTKRPSTVQVYDAFLRFRNLPQVICTPEERLVIGGLPEKLKLRVQGIKISLNEPRHSQFSVRFKYGNKDHTTSPTTGVVGGNEHVWNDPETWLIETDEQNHEQSVSFEVLRISVFRKDRVCATGEFSLLNSVNKAIHVKLEAPDSTRSAELKIFLTEVF